MLLVETGGKTEVGKFDMTTPVKQDVVRLDVTEKLSVVVVVPMSVAC